MFLLNFIIFIILTFKNKMYVLFHFYLLGNVSNFIIQVHIKKCEYREKSKFFVTHFRKRNPYII